MRILELQKILEHCRIEAEEEQSYICSLGEAAESVVEKYLNRSYEDIATELGFIPQPIQHACYLVVADLYRNREASSQVQVYGNPALMALLRPYKRLI